MNKVILIGRMTKDPELNFQANSGMAICRINLAVTRQFKKDETDFINCVAFGKIGETISQYFTKGKPIAITGNIRTGSYDAKDGTKRYTTDVVVESFEFIGQGNNSNQGNTSNNFNQDNNFYDDMIPTEDDGCPF